MSSNVAAAFQLMTFTSIPPRNNGESRSLYPFHLMEPGTMFFVPAKEGATDKDVNLLSKKLSTSASQNGRALSEKRGEKVSFAIRTIEEDGKPGVGVYRLRLNDASEDGDDVAADATPEGKEAPQEGATA